MFTVKQLFDLSHTQAQSYLEGFTYPFEALEGLKDFIEGLIPSLGEEYEEVADGVFAHKSVTIAKTATLTGPCIIGPDTEVRPGAFIRGSVLVGKECVVGNSTELKNVILFDNVQVPHYNYVGDSILGYKSHMGAGSITSNVKSDKTEIVLSDGKEKLPTGRVKIGAMLGDHVEVGCGSVLNPGSVIGPDTSIYPLCSIRHEIPAHSIVKSSSEIVIKNR
jgi:NDP-sugar pyrophosphorylase family protein